MGPLAERWREKGDVVSPQSPLLQSGPCGIELGGTLFTWLPQVDTLRCTRVSGCVHMW